MLVKSMGTEYNVDMFLFFGGKGEVLYLSLRESYSIQNKDRKET